MSVLILGYLDPGSGSMILQMILGGLAGFAVAAKMFGRRILDLLMFRRRRDAPVEAGTKAEPDG